MVVGVVGVLWLEPWPGRWISSLIPLYNCKLEARLGNLARPCSQIKILKSLRYSSVVDCLLRRHEALGSISISTERKERRKKERKKKERKKEERKGN
jgi:hypothetical protein